jgi:tellurium resistance protein TerZ
MPISLVKGQKISLAKESGSPSLSKVVMGVGWDMVQTKNQPQKSGLFGRVFGGRSDPETIDLDASCIMFNEQKQLFDAVYFGQLSSKDGSVRHAGDNRTGEGDGDDEQIVVELNRIPASVRTLIFTVSSFRGQTFDQVVNAYCRILNGANSQEIAKYTLSSQGSHTAQIMAKIYQQNGDWKMAALGDNCNGRTFDEMMPSIVAHI